MSGINLWLDDVRDPLALGYVGWTWVKNAQEAVDLLKTGAVVRASLGHDLDMDATLGYTARDATGYDVVLWMEANDVWPPEGVTVHSMNPSGKKRMEMAIQRAYERRRELLHPTGD